MKLNFTLREPIEATKRRRMTPARKRHIHGLAGGRCGCGCGDPVPVSGPGVEYEHETPVWEGGADEWPNLRPWTPEHHKPKTARDASRRGKTKRMSRKQSLAEERPKSKRPLRGGAKLPTKGKGPKLRGRPFAKGKARKIQSRGFR